LADFFVKKTRQKIEGFVQGCQKVYNHIKNPNLGKFLKALKDKILKNFMAIWHTYFTAIWYYLCRLVFFGRFGMFYHEKSGNPGCSTDFY
jgi:hypothetical protein